MRILLAAKYVPSGPTPIGGVVSWVWTIRRALERAGHAVEEWQPKMPRPAPGFDLGIIANATLTSEAANWCERSIEVCHGFLEGDRPLGTLDRSVFVSESTAAKWSGSGEIVRQPIDLDFWAPLEGAERSGAVRYSYRRTPTHCEAACERLGLPYRQVGGVSYESARDALRAAKVVFASGRAALEAMACGAKVVIYDHRQTYQPPMLGGCLHDEMPENYSGRAGVANPSIEQVVEAIQRAAHWRGWVERNHNAEKIVEKLLC
jgi:hypothetical protein